jgi:hypothetical protein
MHRKVPGDEEIGTVTIDIPGRPNVRPTAPARAPQEAVRPPDADSGQIIETCHVTLSWWDAAVRMQQQWDPPDLRPDLDRKRAVRRSLELLVWSRMTWSHLRLTPCGQSQATSTVRQSRERQRRERQLLPWPHDCCCFPPSFGSGFLPERTYGSRGPLGLNGGSPYPSRRSCGNI